VPRLTLVLVSLAALAGPVHAAMTLSPIATAGGWRILAATDPEPACAAYRDAPQADAASVLALRMRAHSILRIETPAHHNTPGMQIKVVLDAGARVKGTTAGTFISPTQLDVDLGDLVSTLRRIGDAPATLRLPDRTLTLRLDGLAAMLEALSACVTERIGPDHAGRAAELPAAPADIEVIEERTFLETRIGGETYRLETLLVRPANAAGRLPVALLAHGQGAAETMPGYSPENLLPEARDLARRGYLAAVVMRRGFGRSDGIPGVPSGAFGATCGAFARALFEASADDLEAALAALGARDDADLARVLAIGQSAGGPAALALAARGAIRAVASVSGGLRCNRRDSDDAVAEALAAIGARTTVPALWLYAPHDSFFSEPAVHAMHAAYTAAGGKAHLVMTPAIKGDGHDLFTNWDGRNHWLAALDPFLRRNGLPTWAPELADAVMRDAAIPQVHRAEIEAYLSELTPKVLLVDRATRRPFGASLPFGLANAHALARIACTRAGADCVPAMENFRLVIPTEQATR
jgi:dienelactone hydrolase